MSIVFNHYRVYVWSDRGESTIFSQKLMAYSDIVNIRMKIF